MAILLDHETRRTGALRLGRGAVVWLLLAGVLAAAVLLRILVPINNDVSWLLTAGDQVLAGHRLYADVLETNPPIAVLAYIPATLIGRWTGLAPEIVVAILVLAAISLALACAVRIARRFDTGRALSPVLIVLGFAILAIVPFQEFAQREHIAIIAAVPMIAVLIARANGEALPRWAKIAAGLGAGIMLMFKPHFALGLVCTSAALAIRRRDVRLLATMENVVAGLIFAAYVVFIIAVFPDFFSVIGPLAKDVYIPVGRPFGELISEFGMLCWTGTLVLAFALKPGPKSGAAVNVLLAMSGGLMLAFLLQRKGWPYHAYPMVAVALFACGVALTSSRIAAESRALRAIVTAAFVLLLGSATFWFRDASNPAPLTAYLSKFGPNPSLLVVGGEASVGHPAVRVLHGRWVSRQSSLWVTNFVRYMRAHGLVSPEKAPVLDRYVARERAWLIEDIKRRPPTLVLVDNLTGAWGGWLRADPELTALLKPFRRVGSFERIDVLQRTE